MSQVIQKLRESQIYQESLKASNSFLAQKGSAKNIEKLQIEKNEEDGNSKSTSKGNQRSIKQEPNEQGKIQYITKGPSINDITQKWEGEGVPPKGDKR